MLTISRIPHPFLKTGRTEEKRPLVSKRVTDYLNPAETLENYTIVIHRLNRPLLTSDMDKDILLDGDEILICGKIEKKIDKWWAWLFPPTMLWNISAVIWEKTLGFLQPATPAFAGSKSSTASSPTYAWDGIKNLANVGVPVPVVYGTHYTGGNYINQFITTDRNKSYMNVLILLSEGPVSKVAGIPVDYAGDLDNVDPDDIGDKLLIDGNPVTNYQGVQVFVRHGYENQTPIPGFSFLSNPRNTNFNLTKGNNVDFTTVITNAERVDLIFTVDSLYGLDEDDVEKAELDIDVFYKQVDAGSYTQHGTFSINEKVLTSKQFTYSVDGLTADQYEFRLVKTTRNSGDKNRQDVRLTSINEIQYRDLAYPGSALLGLKVLATDQLSGSLPDIRIQVDGRLVQVWDTDEEEFIEVFSKNPIWCIMDLITNVRYGIGNYIQVEHLDIERFKEMAAYCDELVTVTDNDGEEYTEARYELDIVLDSSKSAMDWLVAMCLTCMAFLVYSGGTVYPIIDKPENINKLFCEGNIKSGSFSEIYRSQKEFFNIVSVQFFDEENRNERDIEPTQDPAIDAGSVAIKEKVFEVPGVVRRSQASRLGRHWLLQGKHQIRGAQFVAGPDAINYGVGDVIGLQHPVPQWGYLGGRVKAGSDVNNIVIDQTFDPPPYASGQHYVIRVQHADDTIEETRTFQLGPVAAGDPIPVDPAFDTAPQPYDTYTIGLVDIDVKPFRVMQMRTNDNEDIEVVLDEYVEEIYDETNLNVQVPNFSTLPDPRRPPGTSTNLTAINQGGWNVKIHIGWQLPTSGIDAVVDYSSLYYSLDGGNTWTWLADVNGDSYSTSSVTPGLTYYFKVVNVSKWGVKEDFDTAPTVSIVPFPDPPAKVSGLELKGKGNDTVFDSFDAEFSWRPTGFNASLVDSTLGAGSGSPNKYFSHYVVEIWTSGIGAITYGGLSKRRNEIVNGNYYNYSFSNNWEDHEIAWDIPVSRTIQIKVWAIDVFNQSSEPAVLNVSNPEPAALSENVTFVETTGSVYTSPTPILLVKFSGSGRKVVIWSQAKEQDAAGYILRGTPTLFGSPIYFYQGPNNFFELPTGMSETDFDFHVGVYDKFDDTIGAWAGPNAILTDAGS